MAIKSPAGWFDGLQALRAILFLLVFVSHSGSFFRTDGAWGGAAVAMFFVLSGFLAGQKTPEAGGCWWKESLCVLWRKIRKFWILHLVFLLIAAWLLPGRFRDFVRCLLLVQSYCGRAKVALSFNWPTWFLSSLMLCYLLSPVLNRRVRRAGSLVWLLLPVIWAVQGGWAAVWMGTEADYGPGYYWVYICPLARLADFTCGLALARLHARYAPLHMGSFARTGCELAVVAAFAALLRWHGWLPQTFQYSLLWMPIALCLIWIFAEKGGLFTRACCNPVLMWIGACSFELYVAHRMILEAVARFGGKNVAWWLLAVVATVAAAVLSSGFSARVKKWGRGA